MGHSENTPLSQSVTGMSHCVTGVSHSVTGGVTQCDTPVTLYDGGHPPVTECDRAPPRLPNQYCNLRLPTALTASYLYTMHVPTIVLYIYNINWARNKFVLAKMLQNAKVAPGFVHRVQGNLYIYIYGLVRVRLKQPRA